jgi:hypothetical protein
MSLSHLRLDSQQTKNTNALAETTFHKSLCAVSRLRVIGVMGEGAEERPRAGGCSIKAVREMRAVRARGLPPVGSLVRFI